MSLNQWIAVAEKVGVVETAPEVFKKRAAKATGAGLIKFLRNAPDGPPEPEDAVRLSDWPTLQASGPGHTLQTQHTPVLAYVLDDFVAKNAKP